MEKDINKRKPFYINGMEFIPVKHSEIFNKDGTPIHGICFYWNPEIHISSRIKDEGIVIIKEEE